MDEYTPTKKSGGLLNIPNWNNISDTQKTEIQAAWNPGHGVIPEKHRQNIKFLKKNYSNIFFSIL